MFDFLKDGVKPNSPTRFPDNQVIFAHMLIHFLRAVSGSGWSEVIRNICLLAESVTNLTLTHRLFITGELKLLLPGNLLLKAGFKGLQQHPSASSSKHLPAWILLLPSVWWKCVSKLDWTDVGGKGAAAAAHRPPGLNVSPWWVCVSAFWKRFKKILRNTHSLGAWLRQFRLPEAFAHSKWSFFSSDVVQQEALWDVWAQRRSRRLRVKAPRTTRWTIPHTRRTMSKTPQPQTPKV